MLVRLTAMGHEVIGIDTDMNKVEGVKDKITHAINLNATSLPAVKTLAFKDTAVVIISIGEDIGASIMTTAIFRQLNVKRLISRPITPLHETVL